jgi:hypothetical protein
LADEEPEERQDATEEQRPADEQAGDEEHHLDAEADLTRRA